MTWNLLNYDEFSGNRTAYFQIVIDSMKPEILAVQEVEGLAGATLFHQEVLEEEMAFAEFIEGPDSEMALFYDSTVFEVMEVDVVPTALRNIGWYTLNHIEKGAVFHVFVAHLKSSTGVANENQRLAEVNELREITDALGAGSYFIACGDFNIYGSDEPAYQRLLEQDGEDGYFIDPIGFTGTWNDESYAEHHTQSPRTRSFGGGASGGLDDRFDMIIFSHTFGPNGAIQYMYNTSWAVGNDGQHYNDSINSPTNTTVSPQMANALHYASDHLPVVTSIRFVSSTNIEEVNTFRPMLYPNPASKTLHLKGLPMEDTRVSIVDSSGRIVLEEFVSANKNPLKLDVSHLLKGTYIVCLEGKETKHSERLVLE